MDRRAFIEKMLAALALGGIFLSAGCQKNEKVARHGNEEKLWNLAIGQEKAEESLDLSYAKDTPAFYRDASLGKIDPSFIPKTGGG